MLDKKRIKDDLKDLIRDTYPWLSDSKIRGKHWFDTDLTIDDDELNDLKHPIQNTFNIQIRKREIRGCIDVNDLVDLIYNKITEQHGVLPDENAVILQYRMFFSMAAKLAKADGSISKQEIEYMENLMVNILELELETRQWAIGIWNEAKNSTLLFDDYAYSFMSSGPDISRIRHIFELLFCLAAADKQLHSEEEALLKNALYIFGLPLSEFERFKNLHFVDTSKYYTALGCTRSDSMDTVRAKYKALLLTYHPDRMTGKNLPPDIIKVTETKTREIIEAFEAIERERGLRS
jgi:DnaJ like chaperone protein